MIPTVRSVPPIDWRGLPMPKTKDTEFLGKTDTRYGWVGEDKEDSVKTFQIEYKGGADEYRDVWWLDILDSEGGPSNQGTWAGTYMQCVETAFDILRKQCQPPLT